MTKITFLGGDATGNVGSVAWGRFTFALNLPTDCDDPHIIAKAGGNPFFRVEGNGTAGKVEVEIVLDDEIYYGVDYAVGADIPTEATEMPVQAIPEPEAPEPSEPKRRGRPPKAK